MFVHRFKNDILCDLHFQDVSLMECSDFMQQLRSFKPQSLGCAVARRKSSTTLIFPLPPQACSGKASTLTIETTLLQRTIVHAAEVSLCSFRVFHSLSHIYYIPSNVNERVRGGKRNCRDSCEELQVVCRIDLLHDVTSHSRNSRFALSRI